MMGVPGCAPAFLALAGHDLQRHLAALHVDLDRQGGAKDGKPTRGVAGDFEPTISRRLPRDLTNLEQHRDLGRARGGVDAAGMRAAKSLGETRAGT